MKFCMRCMTQYDDKHKKCPECGFEEGAQPFNSRCLEPGVILCDRYIVGMPLNISSWFVRYIGWDALTNRRVTLYEYSPARFAVRNIGEAGLTVLKKNEFYRYMERFVKKAQLLAQLHLPDNVADVYEVFEKNNTSYAVSQYAEGMTLSEYIEKNGAVSPQMTEKMFLPVLRSVDRLHESGFIIGGFSPEDILVMEDGSLFLCSYLENALLNITDDRTDITDKERRKYYAYERLQATDQPSLQPACDVYSAAVIMHSVMGVPVPEAEERDRLFERKHKDSLRLASSYRIRLDSNKEAALRNASYVDAAFRTPDMDSFIKELLEDKRVKIISKKGPALPVWARVMIPAVCAALIAGGTVLFIMKNRAPSLQERMIVTREELSPGLTVVPAADGLGQTEAAELLKGSGLIAELLGREVRADTEPDRVIFQSIPAGTIVEKNTVVGMTLSAAPPAETAPEADGSFAMLDLTLLSRREAERLLSENGLAAEIREEKDEQTAAGLVISQQPAAGSMVKAGDRVTLTVSLGRPLLKVPDISGKDSTEAVGVLTEAGFVPMLIYGDQNGSEADGRVISQSVEADTELPKGSPVIVTVNSGSELSKVPSVTGLSRKEAAERLAAAGFALGIYAEGESAAEGVVISQFPAADSPAKTGSEVTVVLAEGQPAAEVNISPVKKSLSVGDEFVLKISCVNIPDLVSVNYELSEEGVIEPVYIDKQTLSMTFKALKAGSVTVEISYGSIVKHCSVEVTD
ncbi:MAG: PASTA domain-containing protein [Ruminococcus sp.]|nr:PASTA domain-containing protein [Ruminococcus sp.]